MKVVPGSSRCSSTQLQNCNVQSVECYRTLAALALGLKDPFEKADIGHPLRFIVDDQYLED